MSNTIVGAGAALHYDSGSDQMMRLLTLVPEGDQPQLQLQLDQLEKIADKLLAG
jgi:hypothetical protein